jgi:hypothetical protein
MIKLILTQKQLDTLAALLDAGVKSHGLACVIDAADLLVALKSGEKLPEVKVETPTEE